jgi:RHS repeat-associated protein
MPNGVSATNVFDSAGRLSELIYSKGSTVLRDLQYGYDERNLRTSFSGNPVLATPETEVSSASVNALNQYTSLNGQNVTYDNNGNQSQLPNLGSAGTYTAQWDARDRLIGLSGPNLAASFTYDALGRRTNKTVSGQSKTYLYDGSDIISETGSAETVYTYGPGVDQPLLRRSTAQEFYIADALGSVIALTDSIGNIQTAYSYSPFGKVAVAGSQSENPYKFTAREDDGTGFYYYRARYYSPEQKRFISEDPLGFGGGDTNIQAYVGGNPVNAIDPSGEWVWWVVGGVVGTAVVHWTRNVWNKKDVTFSEAKRDWDELPAKESMYHKMGPGNEDNRKFVSRNGGNFEAVFTSEGDLVTDPLNMGTYNFFGPKVLWGIPHSLMDVIPYYIFGNTPQDMFTSERFTTTWDIISGSKGSAPSPKQQMTPVPQP